MICPLCGNKCGNRTKMMKCPNCNVKIKVIINEKRSETKLRAEVWFEENIRVLWKLGYNEHDIKKLQDSMIIRLIQEEKGV